MIVASGAMLTVKLIRKRHGKVSMIAKDLIPEMGTISFVIMKGGRESEVGVLPGAGVTMPWPGWRSGKPR